MVISQAKITSKRQLTLPIKIMHRLQLNPGDPVIFEDKNGHIEITSKAAFTIEELIRKYQKLAAKKISNEEINKARAKSWSSRART